MAPFGLFDAPVFGSKESMWLMPPTSCRKMMFLAVPNPGRLGDMAGVWAASRPRERAPSRKGRMLRPKAARAQRSTNERRECGSREMNSLLMVRNVFGGLLDKDRKAESGD